MSDEEGAQHKRALTQCPMKKVPNDECLVDIAFGFGRLHRQKRGHRPWRLRGEGGGGSKGSFARNKK